MLLDRNFVRDEAARVWQQREAEWARERQARQRLMQEVLILSREKMLK